ncbi:MAG: hypothetical protein ACO2ZM_09925 [Francisellaceae bacterium]
MSRSNYYRHRKTRGKAALISLMFMVLIAPSYAWDGETVTLKNETGLTLGLQFHDVICMHGNIWGGLGLTLEPNQSYNYTEEESTQTGGCFTNASYYDIVAYVESAPYIKGYVFYQLSNDDVFDLTGQCGSQSGNNCTDGSAIVDSFKPGYSNHDTVSSQLCFDRSFDTKTIDIRFSASCPDQRYINTNFGTNQGSVSGYVFLPPEKRTQKCTSSLCPQPSHSLDRSSIGPVS